MERLRLALKTIPPLADHPRSRACRLAEDGEECRPVRRVAEGVLVSLTRDGYLTIVQPEEIVPGSATGGQGLGGEVRPGRRRI